MNDSQNAGSSTFRPRDRARAGSRGQAQLVMLKVMSGLIVPSLQRR